MKLPFRSAPRASNKSPVKVVYLRVERWRIQDESANVNSGHYDSAKVACL